MDSKSIKSFFHKNWTWLLPVLPMVVLGFLLNMHGLRLTYDSHQFLCAASSFRQDGNLIVCDGSSMVLSAPGFSLLLSLCKEPVRIYSAISPFLYGITLSCWLYVAKRRVSQVLWPIFIGLPLFLPFLFLWSEGPFMTLFSLGILGLEKYRATGNRAYLWAAILFFPLAISLRYAGVFIIAPILIWEFFEQKKNARRYLILALALMVLTIVAMGTRNWILSHSFMGIRGEGSLSFFQVLLQCAMIVANWLVPISLFGRVSVVLFALVAALITRTDFKSAFLVGMYFILIVISAFSTDIEHDERLFIPIYPMFVLSVSEILFKEGTKWWRWILYVLWLCYLLVRYTKNILFWFD